MRFAFSWIILYVVLAGIFLLSNGDLALSKFQVNLIFGTVEISLLPFIIGFSVLWMIILMLVDAMKIDSLTRDVEKLKAQLHDMQSEEIATLRGYMEAQIREATEEVLEVLKNIESMIENLSKREGSNS